MMMPALSTRRHTRRALDSFSALLRWLLGLIFIRAGDADSPHALTLAGRQRRHDALSIGVRDAVGLVRHSTMPGMAMIDFCCHVQAFSALRMPAFIFAARPYYYLMLSAPSGRHIFTMLALGIAAARFNGRRRLQLLSAHITSLYVMKSISAMLLMTGLSAIYFMPLILIFRLCTIEIIKTFRHYYGLRAPLLLIFDAKCHGRHFMPRQK